MCDCGRVEREGELVGIDYVGHMEEEKEEEEKGGRSGGGLVILFLLR